MRYKTIQVVLVATTCCIRHALDRSLVVDPLSYFSLLPVIDNWYNNGCGVVRIKEPLLLIGNSSLCSGSSGFLLPLCEWFFTICPKPYNRKTECVECIVE